MTNTDKIELVRAFVKKAHANQIRKNSGLPYYTHLEAVEHRALILLEAHFMASPQTLSSTEKEDARLIVSCVALAHDLKEDQPAFWDEFVALIETFENEFIISTIIDNVNRLTRPSKAEDILKYLSEIKASLISKFVKLADTNHNLEGLAPGNLRDKYILSLYILNS